MKKLGVISSQPGRRTLLAALIATMCAPALASNDLVISQIYGAGGNSGSTYPADFVEIYNRTDHAIALDGKSVQYASTSGTSWGSPVRLTGSIEAGGYFLVGMSASATGADQIGGYSMAAGAGKVALVNSITALSGAAPTGSQIIDIMAYGPASTPVEGAPAPAASADTAVRRKDSCVDTDVNADDFEQAKPFTPRNKATEPHVCGTPPVAPIVASCPAGLYGETGDGNSVSLSATDADSVVNNVTITSVAIPGVSLQNFSAATEIGGEASVTLAFNSSAAQGTYPVTLQFTNDTNQKASCTVSVKVRPYGHHRVPEIQGSGPASPFTADADKLQATSGIVTAKVGSGFFIQDANGDGDPNSSDGVYVFSSDFSDSVNVGDEVKVWGTVTEYTPNGAPHSVTELSFIDKVTVLSSGHSLTPVNLGDLPDTDLTKVEGMLVHFNNPMVISQSEFLGPRGELSLSSGARLESPANRFPFGSPEYTALVAANAKNLIVLDDGIFVTPDTVPYLDAQGTRRAGGTVSNLTGVLDFGAYGGSGAGYKLQPTEAPVFGDDNPRPVEPQLAPGNVRVASANVLNFFTEFTNLTDVDGNTTTGCYIGSGVKKSNCRGADNMEEFIRQRDKIVNALLAVNADAYGLMEVQNNGEKSVNYLVSALNAAVGYPAYAAVPVAGSDATARTTGTDAIRVAIIYKPASLTLVGPALTDPDSINNRAPVAATFKAANGGKFSLVVNHFRAKGSCDSSKGASEQDFGEGCWNQTRINQANRLTSYFLPQVTAAAGSPNVLVVGDLNALGHEDPILTLEANGLQNQIERFIRPREMPHSYVFGHMAGYLDHALASASLAPQVADVAEFHNNADEPSVIDYNLDGNQPGLYQNNAYRASDHDPVVISLNLAASFSDITGSIKSLYGAPILNRSTGKFSASYKFTNTSGAPLTGPFQIELANLPAGVSLDNASGTHDGKPYVTVNSASLAAGATGSVSLVFSNPSKVGISYSASVYSGTF